MEFFHHTVKKLHTKYASLFAKYDGLVNEIIAESSSIINSISNHIMLSGGKRLRPIFAFASGSVYGDADRILPIAVCSEMLHAATLLHDDIVDNGDKRRGNLTAKAIWGNKKSLLVGDFLLSQVFKMLTDFESMSVMKVITEATARIATAELMQIEECGNLDITYDKCISISKEKTAPLFEASCILPAIVLGAPKEEIDLWRSFAENFGICFQIMDDVNDYYPGGPDLGKGKMNDLAEGRITLPAMLLMNKDNSMRDIISNIVNGAPTESDYETISKRSIELGIFAEVEDYIKKYMEAASSSLKKIAGYRKNSAECTDINLLSELLLSLNKAI